jgi:magnesium transporter
MPIAETFELAPALREALTNGDARAIAGELRQLHATEAVDVLRAMPAPLRRAVLAALPDETAAEVLAYAGASFAQSISHDLSPERLADLLDTLPEDDAAAVLDELPDNQSRALLELMERQEAAEVRGLLTYPDDSAGRLMTQHFVRVSPDMTGGEAMNAIRRADPAIETINDLYVVDEAGTLAGVLALRTLIAGRPEQTVGELMVGRVVAVRPDTDREEVARLVARYDLLAIPVVDATDRILGIITVDDVIDVMIEESTEDVLQMAAVDAGDHAAEQPYLEGSILRGVRQRLVWLLMLFLAGTFTGGVLQLFEGLLANAVALSFFIPLLIGTGGNAGAQSVTTVIRALVLREIAPADALRVLGREAATGLLLGALLGLVAFGHALFWMGDPTLALVVALAVPAICTWSASVGSLVPLLAQRLRLDPTVMSAPVITTVVDATGLLIYFSIAGAIMA